jgi:hypothetical protein
MSMGQREGLLYGRILDVFTQIVEELGSLIEISPFETEDPEDFLVKEALSLKVPIARGHTLVVVEKYFFEEYQLHITKYNYSLVDPQNKLIVSYDNLPHHPELSNFPHHKHLYPKGGFSPISFSGKLTDALKEIKTNLGEIK